MNIPVKVLIIDANPIDLQSTKKLLQSSASIQFTIFTAESLNEGFEHINKETIDVIILDINLKVSQGMETLMQLNKLNLNLPVVILTASDNQQLAVTAIKENVQDYLIKEEVNFYILSHALLYAIERNALQAVDKLTQLGNRAAIEKKLNSYIANAELQRHSIGILHLDLDRFKTINQVLGRTKGDNILREVAERLRRCISEDDYLGRMSCDEFVILMKNNDTKASVELLARKIIDSIAEPFLIDDKYYYLSTSIGISIYPDDGQDKQTLLSNADIARNNAKLRGGNGFQFATSNMVILATERLTLEIELHHALRENQFKLVYQPKVDIKTNKIVGLEALVRWFRPDEKVIGPNEFIPVAEESNLIMPINEWTIMAACEQLKQWLKQGLEPPPVSINVSAQQLDVSFFKFISSVLQQMQLSSKYLEFELTEKTLIRETVKNIALLNAIKKLGIKIAIDDFGQKYSSLAYLKIFPIDYIKIDQSFIAGLPQDLSAKAIVSAMITMAHSLDITVIAEGVEQKEQLEFLAANNCDQYQGFYFSKPLLPDMLVQLLDVTNKH